MTVTFRTGDVREQLAALPADHFDAVVTSPPYWGLRDYDVVGQIGLEPTLGEHLEVMVAVFREVRRVMKPSGVLWLNYGDCYATAPNGRKAAATKAAGGDDRTFRDKPFSTVGPIYSSQHDAWPVGPGGRRGGGNNRSPGLKPKDLCMVPNRLAIALQDDGWWVRAENIWAKPNPMPESIRDRPATAHEKIFMLTKAERYSYDAEAVRVEASSSHGAPVGGWAVAGEDHSVLGFSRTGRAERASKGRQRGDSFSREAKTSAGDHGQKPQFRPEREAVAYLRGGGRSLRNYEPAPLGCGRCPPRPSPTRTSPPSPPSWWSAASPPSCGAAAAAAAGRSSAKSRRGRAARARPPAGRAPAAASQARCRRPACSTRSAARAPWDWWPTGSASTARWWS